MTSNVKVVVVGAGWVSRTRHVPALHAHPDVELLGMVAPAESLRAVPGDELRKLGITRTATGLDSPLAASADAVMIGTPPTTHAALVEEALLLGKHVLVEKPMTMTTAEADRLIALAAEQSLILAVVHNLQFCRSAVRARDLLDRGDLGELRGTMGLQSSNHRRRLPVWYQDLPLGLFTDETAHLIYLTQAFLPEATATNIYVGDPISERDNTPDMVSIAFRSNDRRPGHLLMSFVGSVSEWAFVLQCEERTVVIDLFRDILVELPNDNSHLGKDVLRTTVSAVGTHLAGVVTSGSRMLTHRLDYGNHEVVRRFVQAVRSGEAPPRISADDGRRVVEVI